MLDFLEQNRDIQGITQHQGLLFAGGEAAVGSQISSVVPYT